MFSVNSLIVFIIFRGIECKILSTDPDIYADVPGFLLSRGFYSESHSVLTSDGYILTIFRIINPYINRKNLKYKPILLWHGLFDSAEAWLKNKHGRLDGKGVYWEENYTIFNDCNSSITSTLGFTLSSCGYDVWLANNRGNQYAYKHINNNLSIADPKFWDYSLTEVALYDLTATVHYVLRITNRETMSYIGYSMGNTIMFALLSLRPEYEKYFRPFIALAPVAFYGHAKGLFKVIAPIEPFFRKVTIGLGLPVPAAEFFGSVVCGNSVLVIICQILTQAFFGPDPLNQDKSRLPAYLGNFFDIISTRVVLHFAQLINSGRFAQFNYGVIGNNIHYNSDTSPDYPLKNIRSKDIILFGGQNDYLGNPTDVDLLIQVVPDIKLIKVAWPYWNHGDPHMAIHENKYQDIHILRILRDYNRNSI